MCIEKRSRKSEIATKIKRKAAEKILMMIIVERFIRDY
jgi:hypothetical protein